MLSSGRMKVLEALGFWLTWVMAAIFALAIYFIGIRVVKIRRRRDDNDTTDERDDGDNFDEHIQTQNERGAIVNIFDSLFDAFAINVDRIADKIDKSMLRLEDMAAELIEKRMWKVSVTAQTQQSALECILNGFLTQFFKNALYQENMKLRTPGSGTSTAMHYHFTSEPIDMADMARRHTDGQLQRLYSHVLLLSPRGSEK
eukprot:scaffold7852_cov151-Skeletonema_menzelii.AAC.19